MRGVRRPHRVALPAAVALAAAALAAGIAVGASGDTDAAPAKAAKPAQTAQTHGYRRDVVKLDGKALQSASCEQWLAATPQQRAAIVDVLHDVVGGPTPYGPAKALSADEATALFDRRCPAPYARGWLLYELYTRAAAFSNAMDRFK